MKKGKCIKCSSSNVYRADRGIGGNDCILLKSLSWSSVTSSYMTYICTDCGYYENYISNKGDLEKVKGIWEKV